HPDHRPAQLRRAARQAGRAFAQVLLLRRERVGDAGARRRKSRPLSLCVQRRIDVPPEHVPASQGVYAAPAEGSRLSNRDDLRRFPGNLSRQGTGFLRPCRGEGIPGGGRGVSAAYDTAVRTAREYYDSDDADNFYFHVWG